MGRHSAVMLDCRRERVAVESANQSAESCSLRSILLALPVRRQKKGTPGARYRSLFRSSKPLAPAAFLAVSFISVGSPQIGQSGGF
jgi:hypothetical protein